MNQTLNREISATQDNVEAIDILVKEIVKAIRGNTIHCDRTYQSIIKRITPKGYVVLDSSGCERTVQCSIPNAHLGVMQKVWIKEPMADLKGIHICGVIGK